MCYLNKKASSLFGMGKIDCDFIWRGGHDKLVSIAKSLCFAAFASSHARRGSMSNRPINLSNVSLTTQYSEEP
ncbi:hypothetical protein QD47_11025 [Paenibacillus terrae]|uniref:Uncharacterized protein n=1 Tax=Paenibacillus terrae TaxID=159743 RepID=A0A0D7X2B9_9BACL|nr:hypothetical protein QD47_11025 [Paenibacillus terrae]